jgi:hypothetical protein
MTESEWRGCTSPRPMLLFLLGTRALRVIAVEAFPACRGSDRKLRLFACACYHRLRDLLPDPVARAAVLVAERFADDSATAEALERAEARLREELDALEGPWRASRGAARAALLPRHDALALALQVTLPEAPKAAYYASSNAYLAFAAIRSPGAVPSDRAFFASQTAEERAQTDLLRCVFGPLPFRPVPSELSWRSPAVLALAAEIYEERRWGNLSVLADALSEAGCTDEAVLAHCRSPGPHTRGCWPVDLLLNKE